MRMVGKKVFIVGVREITDRGWKSLEQVKKVD